MAVVCKLQQRCMPGQAGAVARRPVTGIVIDAAPAITQSALLKNNDRGNKKALIGTTNQGFSLWKAKNIV
ncbi:MAG: hypothetical protein AAGH76_02870 [Pseudomonadota bacterium]